MTPLSVLCQIHLYICLGLCNPLWAIRRPSGSGNIKEDCSGDNKCDNLQTILHNRYIRVWKNLDPTELDLEKKLIFKYNLEKKDVFISRGWGAGGMPIGLLHARPAAIERLPSDDGLARIYRKPISELNDVKNIQMGLEDSSEMVPRAAAQVQTPQRQHQTSTIRPTLGQFIMPQLFVSYGWGPLGK